MGRAKKWRVSISENQVVEAPLKMVKDAYDSCKSRDDITMYAPLNLDRGEHRVFKGDGDPPEELMALAYFGMR